MKKLKPLLKITVLFLFLISLFAGCSNLDDSKDDSENGPESALTDSSKGALKISLGSAGARYIAAYNFNLSDYTSWKMTLTEDTDTDETETDADEITVETSDLVYKDETLTASNIPVGKYKVTITGTYAPTSSDSATTYTVSGSKRGVVIAQGDTTAADIFVGPEKTSNGEGSLSLTLTDDTGKVTETNYGTISLCDLAGNIKYSTDDEENHLTATYADDDADQPSTLTITGKNITSGWYKLEFDFDDSARIYVSSDNAIIEIADGITTTNSETITLYSAETKTYYATNDTASGNGLSTLSRINLTALLGNLATNIPDEGEIDIYVNGTPEIDLDAFAGLKSKLVGTEEDHSDFIEKLLYIYNANVSTETAAISLETTSSSGTSSDDTTTTYTTTTSIAGALTLTAGTETTSLDVDKITVEEDAAYTITLKNGAALNVTTANIYETLGICAVTSDGKSNNFGAYTEKTANPFLITTSSVSDKLKLYDSEGNAASYSVSEAESADKKTYAYTAEEAEASTL